MLLSRFLSEDDTLTNDQIINILLAKPDINDDGLISVTDVCLVLSILNESY